MGVRRRVWCYCTHQQQASLLHPPPSLPLPALSHVGLILGFVALLLSSTTRLSGLLFYPVTCVFFVQFDLIRIEWTMSGAKNQKKEGGM